MDFCLFLVSFKKIDPLFVITTVAGRLLEAGCSEAGSKSDQPRKELRDESRARCKLQVAQIVDSGRSPTVIVSSLSRTELLVIL